MEKFTPVHLLGVEPEDGLYSEYLEEFTPVHLLGGEPEDGVV